jgi:hypothetical protein
MAEQFNEAVAAELLFDCFPSLGKRSLEYRAGAFEKVRLENVSGG